MQTPAFANSMLLLELPFKNPSYTPVTLCIDHIIYALSKALITQSVFRDIGRGSGTPYKDF